MATKKKTEHEPHKDIVGQDLVEGDMVAFNPPGIKGLTIGIIRSFSPKSARVEFVRYSYIGNRDDEFDQSSIRYQDMLKVDDYAKTMFFLKHGGLVHRYKLKNS